MSRCSGVAAVEFVVNEYDAVRSEQQAGSQTHRRGAEATKVFVGLFGHRKKIAENKHGVFAEIDIPYVGPLPIEIEELIGSPVLQQPFEPAFGDGEA